jgi:hypothetical protein
MIVLFTSLPVIAKGVFDQDVSARFCLKVRTYLISKLYSLSFFKKESKKLCHSIRGAKGKLHSFSLLVFPYIIHP